MGSVINNKIHLNDGTVGIKAGRNDNIEVVDNVITGKAYYGIRIHGQGDPQDTIMFAEENTVTDNDLKDLKIKAPDDYSDNHADEITFTGSPGKSMTAHIWLDSYSKNNLIKMGVDETVIDEGEGNTIVYKGKEA